MVLSQQNLDDVRRFLELHAEIDALQPKTANHMHVNFMNCSACRRLEDLRDEYRNVLRTNAHFWACALYTAWKDQQRFLAAFHEITELARSLEVHDPAPILNRIAEVQP